MIMRNQKIAILGAGISGLSFAYYLKKFNPTVEFTIYEESNKVLVYVEQGGTVLNAIAQFHKFKKTATRLDRREIV